MQTLRPLSLILLGSLLIGFLYNQFVAEGIYWRFLKPASSTEPGFITADSAFGLMLDGEGTFLDVRVREEYELDRLPNALALPINEFYGSADGLANLDREQLYITYCFEPECRDSEWVARAMMAEGFKNVMILEGGLSVWLEFGFPNEN